MENKKELTAEVLNPLMAEIADKFSDGALIPHEWLRKKFGIKDPSMADCENEEDFIARLREQQFLYMGCIDQLRWAMLQKEQMYLKNEWGDGYSILLPTEQVSFGYNEFVKTIKKAAKEADAIINNVRPVPDINAAKDNDLRARFGMMRDMLASIKKR